MDSRLTAVMSQMSLINLIEPGAIFISLIRACVANEMLKWVGCVRGGGGSPRNCRWGCNVPFFKR